ncbi:MlaD family protein [Aeromicrobium sp. CF3.5]|uniref:MlaD family protein n=1 Tax=Aeromicrobium sp. CF3.5 TaxID=3373078 RepID=UPI003EE4A55B
MLTARTKIQVILFAIVGLLATTYLGATYVGINPFSSGYRVSVELPEAGGTFENGEVTYRGVPVGRIGELEVTPEGSRLMVDIDADAAPIPSSARAHVANRSAIGEQYLDLRAETTGGPMLGDGDELVTAESPVPPPIEDVLRVGRDFAASVPEDSLTVVIDEFYNLSRGVGDDLGRLVDTSKDFVETADENFLVTSSLIENSKTVLATQEEAGDSIRGFSEDLNTIASTLESSDGDLRQLIENSPAAARELDRLFGEVGRPLGVLMGNLVSTAQVFGVNSAGVEDALIRVPEALSVGWTVAGSRGIDLGLVTSFFDPLPCTAGYGGTQRRAGLDTSEGRPFNTAAGCTADPVSGSNVRGPQSLPGRTSDAPPAAARVGVADSLSDLMGGSR